MSIGNLAVKRDDPRFYDLNVANTRSTAAASRSPKYSRKSTRFGAEGSDGAEKSYLRGLFGIETATQNGLTTLLNNVYIFRLPKDYPETYRAKVAAVTPAQVIRWQRSRI